MPGGLGRRGLGPVARRRVPRAAAAPGARRAPALAIGGQEAGAALLPGEAAPAVGLGRPECGRGSSAGDVPSASCCPPAPRRVAIRAARARADTVTAVRPGDGFTQS